MDKGAAWDKSYIDGEVGVHQLVLGLIDSAQSAAQSPELRRFSRKPVHHRNAPQAGASHPVKARSGLDEKELSSTPRRAP